MSAFAGRIGRGYVTASAWLSAGLVFIILAALAVQSGDVIRRTGWGLLSRTWNPPAGEFGIIPMLYGSLAVTVIALLVAVPAGLAGGVYLSEICRPGRRLHLKSFLEMLAGIPSIVYGLLGVALLGPFIEQLFGLQTGRTIFTAAMLLAVMILPTIISLSDDALRGVPQSFRESAFGLGLYRFEVIWSVSMPQARPGLVGAVLLALGRALGETMAVMLVIGSIDRLPAPLYDVLVPGQTLTSKLGREVAESAFGSTHFSALIFLGFVLLSLVVLLTFSAQRLSRAEKVHE